MNKHMSISPLLPMLQNGFGSPIKIEIVWQIFKIHIFLNIARHIIAAWLEQKIY